MEYDIDLTIDEMTYIAELPITELFESVDELPIHFDYLYSSEHSNPNQ
jgi:hypothetical protein